MKTIQTTQVSSSLAQSMAWVCVFILVLLPFHALFTTWLGGAFNQPDVFKVWKEFLLLLLIPGCVVLLVRYKHVRHGFFTSKITLAFFAYLILSLLRSWHGYTVGAVNEEALAYGLLANMRYFAFFLIVSIIVRCSDLLQKNWPLIVLGPATIVTIFGLLQQFILPKGFLTSFNYGPDSIAPYQTIDSKTDWLRAQSTLKGPNPLGAYLNVITTTLVAGVYRSRKYRSLLLALLASVITLLFFTYSRSAFLGITASLATWFLLGITRRKQLAIALGAIFIAGLMVMGGIYVLRNNDFVQNIFFHTDENSTSNSSTNQVRGEALKNGLRNIKAEPLGSGVGTAGPASWHNDKPVRIAENYYIQVAEEVGVFGVILYLAISSMVAIRLFERRQRTLPRILLASLIGITAINMVSHAWMDDTLSLLWWGLAGIALAPAIMKNSHGKKQTKSAQKTA